MFIVGIDVGGTFTDLTAVDEATGVRGFMARDMKPVFKAKVIGAMDGQIRSICRDILHSFMRRFSRGPCCLASCGSSALAHAPPTVF